MGGCAQHATSPTRRTACAHFKIHHPGTVLMGCPCGGRFSWHERAPLHPPKWLHASTPRKQGLPAAPSCTAPVHVIQPLWSWALLQWMLLFPSEIKAQVWHRSIHRPMPDAWLVWADVVRRGSPPPAPLPAGVRALASPVQQGCTPHARASCAGCTSQGCRTQHSLRLRDV